MEDLQRLSLKDISQRKTFDIVVVLDNIRSALNVGSVFRTSDALGIKAIRLVGITAKPPHKEISRSALGSSHSVPWEYHSTTAECLSALKEAGYYICSVEQVHNSTRLIDFKCKSEKIALIFGNEVKGVSDEFIAESEEVIEIEQLGHKHSMNISVSAGIVLYSLSKQMSVE